MASVVKKFVLEKNIDNNRFEGICFWNAEIPKKATAVSVDLDGEDLCIWYKKDSEITEKNNSVRVVHILEVADESPIADDYLHLNTFKVDGTVLHAFIQ